MVVFKKEENVWKTCERKRERGGGGGGNEEETTECVSE